MRPVRQTYELSQRARRILAFAAIYLLWGGAYLAIRFVVQVIPPFLAAGIRYSLSAAVLLTISFSLARDPFPTRREMLNCIVTGIAMFTFSYSAIYWAETRIPSWLVAVLSSTGYFFTYLAECLILRTERFRVQTLLTVAGGVGGIILLVGAPSSTQSVRSVVAALVGLGATLLWSGMTIVLKRVRLPSSIFQTAGLQLAAAAILLLVFSASLGEWRRCPGLPALLQPGPVFGMAYLVLGGSVTAFTAFHWLLQRESPSLVASSTYVNPIVAMLAGIALVNERYTGVQLTGAAAVLLSVIFLWRTRLVTNATRPV